MAEVVGDFGNQRYCNDGKTTAIFLSRFRGKTAEKYSPFLILIGNKKTIAAAVVAFLFVIVLFSCCFLVVVNFLMAIPDKKTTDQIFSFF